MAEFQTPAQTSKVTIRMMEDTAVMLATAVIEGSVRMKCTRPALILAAVVLLSAVALGAEKGWFGLGVSVDVDGLSLNPTLRTITVQKVFAASPAASAGIVPGDILVEVEDVVVAGSKADLIKAAMEKSVGQTLHLKIRRSTADIREVSMVAVPRPAGQ